MRPDTRGDRYKFPTSPSWPFRNSTPHRTCGSRTARPSSTLPQSSGAFSRSWRARAGCKIFLVSLGSHVVTAYGFKLVVGLQLLQYYPATMTTAHLYKYGNLFSLPDHGRTIPCPHLTGEIVRGYRPPDLVLSNNLPL